MKNHIVKFLDTPIEYLGLSTTITNALKRRNVYSIGDLIDVENEYVLENLRKIGSKSLSSIKEKLLLKIKNTKINFKKVFTKYRLRYIIVNVVRVKPSLT